MAFPSLKYFGSYPDEVWPDHWVYWAKISLASWVSLKLEDSHRPSPSIPLSMWGCWPRTPHHSFVRWIPLSEKPSQSHLPDPLRFHPELHSSITKISLFFHKWNIWASKNSYDFHCHWLNIYSIPVNILNTSRASAHIILPIEHLSYSQIWFSRMPQIRYLLGAGAHFQPCSVWHLKHCSFWPSTQGFSWKFALFFWRLITEQQSFLENAGFVVLGVGEVSKGQLVYL